MSSASTDKAMDGRYEFRVWGRNRRAEKMLAKMADSTTHEVVEDCYLLVDDPSWNAKLRGNTVKIKQLISERKGFEHWVSERHKQVDSTPSPFDDLLDDLGIDDFLGGDPINFKRVVSRVRKHPDVEAIVVSKDRRRYTIGDVRAEATKIAVRGTGDVLHTLVIEGSDLDELKSLRRELDIRGEDNVPVHEALANEFAN